MTTTVVIGTPSIETVIFGAPEVALARTLRTVDAAMFTVVDTDPLPTNATADLFEALLSETTRAEPLIAVFSASTVDVVVVDVDVDVEVAAATVVEVLAAADRSGAAVSRRDAPSMTASEVSAGTVGVPPLNTFVSELTTLVNVVASVGFAAAGETMTTAGCSGIAVGWTALTPLVAVTGKAGSAVGTAAAAMKSRSGTSASVAGAITASGRFR